MPGTSYTPNVPLASGDNYQWQVQAFDGGGALAAASSPLAFSVLAINHAADRANNTVTAFQGTPYQFATSDFGFSDPNDNPPNNLLAVMITSVPTAGTLADNGVAVSAGDLSLPPTSRPACSPLPWSPARSGSPYTSFMFQVQDNGGTANGGVDLIRCPRP